MKKYSIRDILNRFRWHPDLDISKVEIFYVDRPRGSSKIQGLEIEKVGHKFVYLKSGIAIPHHRIFEIRYEGEVVWKKS